MRWGGYEERKRRVAWERVGEGVSVGRRGKE